MNDIQSLFEMLTKYGVPIILSIYLVYWITSKLNGKMDRLTSKLDDLNNSINNLSNRIQRLIDIIESQRK